ncbi:hypothetical protein D3C72_1994620 [compost metagenome]
MAFGGSDQAHRQTFLTGAAGAADAVYMDLGIAGQFDVDDHVQGIDVQAAGGDVGGHQYGQAAVGKQGQHLVTVALLQVAM